MNPAAEWRDYLADVIDAMRKAMRFTPNVNLEVVWRTVQQDLPALCARLEPLLDDWAAGSTNAP